MRLGRNQGVAVAGVVIALAVGFSIGAAFARPAAPVADDEKTAVIAERDAQLSRSAEWIGQLAARAQDGKLEGITVAIVAAPGAPAESVETARAAILAAGATVVTEVGLGDAFWSPELGAFRGEIAGQLGGDIIGADGSGVAGLGTDAVVGHAIIQSMLGEAVAEDAVAAAAELHSEDWDFAASTAVLADVLGAADIAWPLAGDSASGTTGTTPIAPAGFDAVVLVTGSGPAGAGLSLAQLASQFTAYVGEVVVVGGDDATEICAQTWEALSELPGRKPSVLVTRYEALAGAQIVAVLEDQSQGGSGSFGSDSALFPAP